MVNRLQSWIFILVALLTMGWGMVPIVRFIFGLDEQLMGSYIWSVSFIIGGLMSGLTAMLMMVRKQPKINTYLNDSSPANDTSTAAKLHATGLLIFTGVPLMNFLVCYFLWLKTRGQSEYLDYQGREAICFQISIYLYLLMCLFMAYIIIGAFVVPLILLFHLLATLTAISSTLSGKPFRYPANIDIISRRPG
ncbi:MAG: putative Tic20 family protein [Arenicella sp.]|jgi:uncharacterized Tic20 family protein